MVFQYLLYGGDKQNTFFFFFFGVFSEVGLTQFTFSDTG